MHYAGHLTLAWKIFESSIHQSHAEANAQDSALPPSAGSSSKENEWQLAYIVIIHFFQS